MRQPTQQDIRQRRGCLSFPAGRDLHAMDEMEVEIGIGPQNQKVVVVVGGCDRGDGDVAGLGP